MLLQDDKDRQVVLIQDLQSKELSISVYNKRTGKKRTYSNRDMVRKLFCKYA